MTGRNDLGEPCRHEGCSKIVVNRFGLCREHRKKKCQRPGCNVEFIPNSMAKTDGKYCVKHRRYGHEEV
jgi:hypothetical protein